MTKVVYCREVGFDCDGVVRGESEEEVLAQVAAHAKNDHKVERVTQEMIQKVRQVMREEDNK